MTTETQAISYDVVPYESKPFAASHPDTLSAVAQLMGMQPAAGENCRVLELGCAAGWNLIPMAAEFPESQFVGIDLSQRQINDGRSAIEDLRLGNLELHAIDLMELNEEVISGSFDYIIAHGLYSWVPADVQQHILEIYRERLRPQGVGYISYNTFPGWHLRRITRDVMLFHQQCLADSDHRLDAKGKLHQARAMLDFLSHAVSPSSEQYAAVVKSEVEEVRESTDCYIFHEHLETNNEPVYFHEFAIRLGAAGLHFVEEAWPVARLAQLDPAIRDQLQGLANNRLELEQYLDFLFNRTFRRTLVCRADSHTCETADPAVVDHLVASGLTFPQGEVNLAPGQVMKFASTNGGQVSTTNHPWIKTILVTLFERWPMSCSTTELADSIHARVGPIDGLPDIHSQQGLDALRHALLQCYGSQLLLLHAREPQCIPSVSEFPKTTPLRRYQAQHSCQITNARHVVAEVTPFDRALLCRLNGSCDLDELAAQMRQLVISGELEIFRGGDQPISSDDVDDSEFRQMVALGLERLAKSSLLCG